MIRTPLIVGSGLLLVLACGAQPEGFEPQSASGRVERSLRVGSQPDILLFTVDTLRADHLSSYGYARETSPFVDILARRGTRFTRAYLHFVLDRSINRIHAFVHLPDPARSGLGRSDRRWGGLCTARRSGRVAKPAGAAQSRRLSNVRAYRQRPPLRGVRICARVRPLPVPRLCLVGPRQPGAGRLV